MRLLLILLYGLRGSELDITELQEEKGLIAAGRDKWPDLKDQ